MSVSFFYEDLDFRLSPEDEAYVSNWVSSSATTYGYAIEEVNYILCSDEYLYQINKSHLNHDTYTDIITFDLSEQELSIQSDIFISIERVFDNSQSFNSQFSKELGRVLIHGILHLIGFEDKTESAKKIMREKEDLHIKYFNIDIIY